MGAIEAKVKASYFRKLENNRVECLLCPHHCSLMPGETGICKIRTNFEGTLIAEMYGFLSAAQIDPIEKKPLYHFFPGKEILSLGGLGCNFSCDCCQNYHISQAGKKDYPRLLNMTVHDILELAQKTSGNIGLAYTYNEPSVWYEFMLDIAVKAKSKDLKNAVVTNGYINKKPLIELLSCMDAFNVDLKVFDPAIHKQFTGGELKFVLNTLKTVRQEGSHLELTHLVVPGVNDTLKLFKDMIQWIEAELGPDTPLHISRYYPRFHRNADATSSETLYRFADEAKNKLNYVYVGNLTFHEYQNTVCPDCENLVILREGYSIHSVGLTLKGTCKNCGRTIAVVQ